MSKLDNSWQSTREIRISHQKFWILSQDTSINFYQQYSKALRLPPQFIIMYTVQQYLPSIINFKKRTMKKAHHKRKSPLDDIFPEIQSGTSFCNSTQSSADVSWLQLCLHHGPPWPSSLSLFCNEKIFLALYQQHTTWSINMCSKRLEIPEFAQYS